MNVILPQVKGFAAEKGNKRFPVLYLLHGLSDDHSIWLRRTSIERYAEAMGLAVIMPAVDRSFYTDMKHGLRYWTFISEELPDIVQSMFPVSGKREENYVAGLSMGGYGAFKLALTNPDRYAAAASLSGAVNMAGLVLVDAKDDYANTFGDRNEVKGSKNDLFYLAEKLSVYSGPKPVLYQCCGTEDFLYEDNIKFRDFCRKLPLELTYEEEQGNHEWGYWDKKIQRVLEWLPLVK
jgi:Predicted esterase